MMSVLEFIVQMTSALAWPLVAGVAVVLLRKQIKTAADKLVERVGEIARLQFPGGSIDFKDQVEQLARDTQELENDAPKALTAREARDVVLPAETAEQRLIKYEQLATIDPRAAILLPFADIEGAIRQRFHALYPEERRGLSLPRILDVLQRDSKIDYDIAKILKQMSRIRNEAAHEGTTLDVDVANFFLDSVARVLNYLLAFDFFGDTGPTT